MNPQNNNDHKANQAPGMRLFLDSAVPQDWARFLPLGCFYGVTTNPLLLQRADQPCTLANMQNIVAAVAGYGVSEIQVQTWGDSVSDMVACGQHLASMNSRDSDIVVKVPATEMGFQVAAQLKDKDHRVTMTAVYTTGQVLLAAGLEAAYAAPYLNRLIDAGQPGPEIILAMNQILSGTRAPTRLLVASLRSAQQVLNLAEQGLDTFTFGPQVAEELLNSDLASFAAQTFQEAAIAMGRK